MRSLILSACLMTPLALAPATALAQGYYPQPVYDSPQLMGQLQDMLVDVDQLNRRRRPDEFQAAIAHQIEMVQNRFNDIQTGRMRRRQALELADEGLYNILQYNYNGSDVTPPWLSFRTDETVTEMRGLIANRRGGWRGPPVLGSGYRPIPVLTRRPGWDRPPPDYRPRVWVSPTPVAPVPVRPAPAYPAPGTYHGTARPAPVAPAAPPPAPAYPAPGTYNGTARPVPAAPAAPPPAPAYSPRPQPYPADTRGPRAYPARPAPTPPAAGSPYAAPAAPSGGSPPAAPVYSPGSRTSPPTPPARPAPPPPTPNRAPSSTSAPPPAPAYNNR